VTPGLPAALRTCARGFYSAEAGADLLIRHGSFLARSDFTGRFISHGTSTDGTTMAAIDWDAAITALNAGELPCSGGGHQILQLAASLGAGIPVSLSDAITGLGRRNLSHLLAAIRHTAGERPHEIH
jgi:hypothetical protein